MDISSVLSSLSEDDIVKLRKTAEEFFGSTGDSGARPEKKETSLSVPGITPQILGSVAKISSALSSSDPKSDLMYALKPFLSPGRQKKADEAAMMIKLMGVLGALREGKQ
ncbi:MAG: hypothetical protein IJS90_08835 [Clostridia bacterium]|nr:hypothetical protein [Clostridia bacterium]